MLYKALEKIEAYTWCHLPRPLTVLRSEPFYIFWLSSAARHKPVPLVLGGIPRPMVLASFQSLRIAFEGCHWKDYPVVADATIVDNAAKGGLVPALLCLD